MHTYIQTNKQTYIHAYIYTYIHSYMDTNIHAYIRTNLQAYILHTYVHTHIHTLRQTYADRWCDSKRLTVSILNFWLNFYYAVCLNGLVLDSNLLVPCAYYIGTEHTQAHADIQNTHTHTHTLSLSL